MFPPLPIRCLCRCIHVSGFPAFSSLFFSSLCLICGFLPAIAKTLNSLFPWLALRLCLSRFPHCSFSHYKAVFIGEHLLFSPVSFYLSCPPPHHISLSQSFFSPRYWRGFIHVVVHSTGRNPLSRHLVTSFIMDKIITIEAPVGKSPSP